MTLSEVFQSMNLTAYDLTVDMLDVHAVSISACAVFSLKCEPPLKCLLLLREANIVYSGHINVTR